MNRIKQFSVAFLIGLILTGCGMNGNDRQTDQGDNNRETEVEQQGNNEQNGNGLFEGRVEVADEVAERISELDEVERANVFVTNENAYVAVMLANGSEDEVTDDVEDKISEQVRETDENIRNVYVSSNPDFVERATNYADRIQEGEPVEGFIEEFNETIERIFPNAK
ncbi:YhcN/YlaJ family sporulation lipoprotein [Shouchella clausii]|uniref:YhcN/YlaJ family sporulation lipoprotein n=1 Tax=Shouchella clausii TaxID=79880 RepID=UPI001FE7A4F3|nr:YhcN/YlaJ family sporulation lipoprotein [Shouchella clausii]